MHYIKLKHEDGRMIICEIEGQFICFKDERNKTDRRWCESEAKAIQKLFKVANDYRSFGYKVTERR